MTNDDLRALADALEPMARAPRFEDFDVPAFCAWVRACADAEPVARIYTDAEMVHRDERWGRAQAEPCIGNDPACPCQDGDACHYKDAADGTKAWPVPQAEPKREPLSDERIDAALQTDPVLITRLMIGSMTVGEFRAALRRLARIVERALEIGGSDAE